MKVMKVLLVALVFALLHACSAAQQDSGNLALGNQAADGEPGDAGMVGDDVQNALLGGDESFNSQDSGITDNNLTDGSNLSEQSADTGSQEQGAQMDSPAFTSGEAVRYVNRDGVSAYAQPDSSSNVTATLSQGECVLANISGEYAETRHGFIAISDLSEELQPRSFIGNDWR